MSKKDTEWACAVLGRSRFGYSRDGWYKVARIGANTVLDLSIRLEDKTAELTKLRTERDEARRIAGEWRDECCLGEGYAGAKEALPWEINEAVRRPRAASRGEGE